MPSQNYLLENIILETGFLRNDDGAVIGTTTVDASHANTVSFDVID